MRAGSGEAAGRGGEPLTAPGGSEWVLRDAGLAPCRIACPAGIDAKAYVSLIAAGRFGEALEAVRRRNPFPGICGRVCTHPCEKDCARGEIDEPVSICALKRFAADWEVSQPPRAPARGRPKLEKTVAIVGSGPAGLTAAADLAREGVGSVVFERMAKPGGTMVAGIPAYRLPRDVIEREIAAIADLGVEIRTGAEVGSPGLGISDLLRGFKAVFVAAGAVRSLRLGVKGEQCGGVLDCWDFLRKVNMEGGAALRGRVVVVGGGNSAVDAARSSLRSGAQEVVIAYRRTRAEMPANPQEIEEALEEGVKIELLAAPAAVLSEGGRIRAIELVRMKLADPDESGRRRPVPIEGSEFRIEADFLIPAIGQEPDAAFMGSGPPQGLALARGNTVSADRDTCATGNPAVFAGGDVVTGPATVIDAIEAGHRAAKSILGFLGRPGPARLAFDPPAEREIRPAAFPGPPEKRRRNPVADPLRRRMDFREVAGVLSEADARAEAARCLRCGTCGECVSCVPDCRKRLAILPEAGAEIVRVETRDGTSPFGVHKETLTRAGGGGCVTLEILAAAVDARMCRACGECARACQYEAVRVTDGSARVEAAKCKGCGLCAGSCPTGAISLPGFSDSQFHRRLGLLKVRA